MKPSDSNYIGLVEKCEVDDVVRFRRRLMAYESKFTKNYFDQVFTLFPESIMPICRRTFKAYDGLNNLFNLAYEMLPWKIHRALISEEALLLAKFLRGERMAWNPRIAMSFIT